MRVQNLVNTNDNWVSCHHPVLVFASYTDCFLCLLRGTARVKDDENVPIDDLGYPNFPGKKKEQKSLLNKTPHT